MRDKGLVQIYTGNGKGKTTAALGLALRAAGAGHRVRIIQFIKGGQATSELTSIRDLENVEIVQYGAPGFIRGREPSDEERQQAHAALADVRASTQGAYELVILDELNVALDLGLVAISDVFDIIDRKHAAVELVITGRNAPVALIDIADLVTEMREIKHPYESGIGARKGIEY